MGNTAKILILFIIVIVLVGGIFYYQSTLNVDKDSELLKEESADRQALNQSGDEDIKSLLSSLDEEQNEETSLLADEESNGSLSVEENLLVDEVNQTYQNEL